MVRLNAWIVEQKNLTIFVKYSVKLWQVLLKGQKEPPRDSRPPGTTIEELMKCSAPTS